MMRFILEYVLVEQAHRWGKKHGRVDWRSEGRRLSRMAFMFARGWVHSRMRRAPGPWRAQYAAVRSLVDLMPTPRPAPKPKKSWPSAIKAKLD